MKEIWKDIKGYEGLYQISNMGQVKSLNYRHTGREKILKPSNQKGYLFVSLCKNGHKKNYLAHRLEYEAFYGEIPKGMQVNHINEIKTDNRLENLNLMTPKENSNWGTRNKRVVEKMSKPVLQIDKTKNEIIAEFPSIIEVERDLGINSSHISKCCLGKRNTAGGFKWKYK